MSLPIPAKLFEKINLFELIIPWIKNKLNETENENITYSWKKSYIFKVTDKLSSATIWVYWCAWYVLIVHNGEYSWVSHAMLLIIINLTFFYFVLWKNFPEFVGHWMEVMDWRIEWWKFLNFCDLFIDAQHVSKPLEIEIKQKRKTRHLN